MPVTRRRSVDDRKAYVTVERDGIKEEAHVRIFDGEDPMATVNRILQGSLTRRQAPEPSGYDSDSDNEDDEWHSSFSTTRRSTSASATTTLSTETATISKTLNQAQITSGAFEKVDPSESITSAQPPLSQLGNGDQDNISQTTEHLLIAAGSVGATIIIVMIILGLYLMRKRGLSFADVVKYSKNRIHRSPPPPPSKYGLDAKLPFDDHYGRAQQNKIYPPQRAASLTRSTSSKTLRPLQMLGRSESFNQGLTRKGSINKSFYDDSSSHTDSHRRKDSATPSSPILPIHNPRRSASSRNTRSLVGDMEELRYSNTSAQRPLPPPPTFRQFLSNRPSISQRPGIGVGMASRFSWTNSNAPQTPHEVSRDTAAQSIGRDSFMTQRSSVPRFRTVDSWVNQQSTRVEEQRLKQQFRMTQSSTSSGGEINDDIDTVPEMPSMPQHLSRGASTRSTGGGLPGKNVKHQRNDTVTTVQTAPIFKAHPGTEIRFSVRSEVPSEILDVGRKNTAL